MYTGFKVNTSISKSNVSGLNQSQLQSLQRQVDTYTRKLQLQKRKYFAIQDQYKAVTDQYTKQKSKLNLLKRQNSKAESIMLQAKIKSMQSTLDKAVSAFDDTIAYNNKLKGQIDMLRRQKKNYLEMQRILQDQLKKVDEQTDQKIDLLNKKKQKVQDLKQQVIQIKNLNAQERSQTIQKFYDLQKEYLKNANPNDMSSSKLKSSQLLAPNSQAKPQMIDTQPLLKFRLKKMIASNKQKLRLIQQYKKHMMSIQQAFNQIKQKSNITDLNQITTTFIKSQEQNQSLYNYMDYLTQEIDKFDQENKQLQIKIQKKINPEQQKKVQTQTTTPKNDNLTQMLAMPQGLYQKNTDIDQQLKKNQKQTQNLRVLVTKIKSSLQSALTELSTSPISHPSSNTHSLIVSSDIQGMNLNITELNIKDYLAKLQEHINNLLQAKQQVPRQTTSFIKQNATPYSKPLPAINYDELKDKQKDDKKDQSKIIDNSSLNILKKN